MQCQIQVWGPFFKAELIIYTVGFVCSCWRALKSLFPRCLFRLCLTGETLSWGKCWNHLISLTDSVQGVLLSLLHQRGPLLLWMSLILCSLPSLAMESCDLMKNFLLETSLSIVYSILKGVVKHWRSSFGLWVLTQLWMLLYSKHIYFVLGIGFAGFLHWTRMNEETCDHCDPP